MSNIAALTYDPVEILISRNRHSFNNAIDQLEARYRRDPRVRILRAGDGIDLGGALQRAAAKAATGTYFCCMPHDDAYAAGYIDGLVARIASRPDAIVACGVTRYDDLETSESSFAPPIGPDEAPSVELALRLLLFWGVFQLVHGVFRRDLLLRHPCSSRARAGPSLRISAGRSRWSCTRRVEWVPGIECVKHVISSRAPVRTGTTA